MTKQELDEVRRILVAFEDAATWCEQLAGVARTSVSARQTPDGQSEAASTLLRQIHETLRHLESHRKAVAVIRSRIGLPLVGT